MLHLFGRTYLEYEVFYNSKYDIINVSSVEKPHPISEMIGEEFGKVQAFDEVVKTTYGGDVNNFWKEIIKGADEKKKIIYADQTMYNKFLLQYWKNIFISPDFDFLYNLYKLNHADFETKLVMNIDRADNWKKLRPGQLPALKKEEFQFLFETTPVVNALKDMNKEILGFELLLAEFFANPSGTLTPFFLQKLKRLCWRTWISDLLELKNDYLGMMFYEYSNNDIKSFLLSQNITKWFLDPEFNEENSKYILRNYNPQDFKDLYYKINPEEEKNTQGNIWDSFLSLTDALFQNKYLELLDEDIENQKGCTFIRNHLANESNQFMASMIYEEVRLKNQQSLNKFKLL